MNLRTVIVAGVALVDSLTASLQQTVMHAAYTGYDSYGAATYAAPVTRYAIVEMMTLLYRNQQGEEVLQRAVVLFPRSVAVDSRDKITLQDGTTGPILDVRGVGDPGTGDTYYTEVSLGSNI